MAPNNWSRALCSCNDDFDAQVKILHRIETLNDFLKIIQMDIEHYKNKVTLCCGVMINV